MADYTIEELQDMLEEKLIKEEVIKRFYRENDLSVMLETGVTKDKFPIFSNHHKII